jgi:hypothetical protein
MIADRYSKGVLTVIAAALNAPQFPKIKMLIRWE